MLTEDQLCAFLKRLDIRYDEAGHYRYIDGSPGPQNYYVKRPEPERVWEAICYFFHRTPYEIFVKSPSWGHYEVEFSFLPAVETEILGLIE